MNDHNDGIIPEPCLRLSYGSGQDYASIELGDGTGYVRVTDDLRGEYHKMRRWYDKEFRFAEDENSRMRKLCAQMLKTVECGTYDARCSRFSECAAGGFESCLYESELSELGITR